MTAERLTVLTISCRSSSSKRSEIKRLQWKSYAKESFNESRKKLYFNPYLKCCRFISFIMRLRLSRVHRAGISFLWICLPTWGCSFPAFATWSDVKRWVNHFCSERRTTGRRAECQITSLPAGSESFSWLGADLTVIQPRRRVREPCVLPL